jgi:hypothetical protein
VWWRLLTEKMEANIRNEVCVNTVFLGFNKNQKNKDQI